MGRKKFVRKREILPDPKFNDVVVAKFINSLMERGERSIAEAILYGWLTRSPSDDERDQDFKKGLENVKPLLEVKSRRVGGAITRFRLKLSRLAVSLGLSLVDRSGSWPSGALDGRTSCR